MPRLIITRHGHVEGIDPPSFRGRSEIDLSPLGRQQVAATAGRIAANWRPQALYASPMRRCAETAAAIGAALGLEPQLRHELIDIDYGEWQGLTHREAGELYPKELQGWYHAPHLTRFPQGEALQDVAVRSTDFLREVAFAGNIDIAVVGHASSNRVLLLQLLGLPLSAYWTIEQRPCALSVVLFDPERTRVLFMGDTSHVDNLPA